MIYEIKVFRPYVHVYRLRLDHLSIEWKKFWCPSEHQKFSYSMDRVHLYWGRCYGKIPI